MTITPMAAIILAIAYLIIKYVVTNYFKESLKTEFQKEHSQFLEVLKWDSKVREQAVKVAEYLALARQLRVNADNGEYKNPNHPDYKRANQLSWELAIWLPENVYKEMVNAVHSPNTNVNEITTIISVRKLLLGDQAGSLLPENILSHGYQIGDVTLATK